MFPAAARIALATAFIATGAISGAAAGDAPQSMTVIGARNQLLADGSQALALGRYAEGVQLTLAGLDQPNTARDEAAGHSNVCAGYVALKRFTEALEHCNRALVLDRGNWRAFNNRAATYVGLKLFDLAITDVSTGLGIAPNSTTLQKSLEVIKEHQEAASRDRRHRPTKA